MELSEELLCLFTGQVAEDEDSYQVMAPDREINLGAVEGGETYRVAIIPTESEAKTPAESTADDVSHPEQDEEPPVDVGETREVEIDSIGDKGDGIARIDRGYVVIVPDTEVGDQVTVQIETTKENVAFAEVVDRHHRLQND